MFSIDLSDPTPVEVQIVREVQGVVGAGLLEPGDQLPTVRQLAVALRLNANTVAKVYSHLERTGALETRRGVGTFVADADQSSHNEEARESELRAIATRALADASAKGFSAADLRRALNSIAKGATS